MTNTFFKAGKLAGHLPGLLLQAEKVAHSFMRGVHGRRRVGTGETFWQFRHYMTGDSQRDIDWKQTAKRDEPYIRQLEWEAVQTLWMYRDGSESMNYSSARRIPTKKDFAEVMLMALSMLALDAGEQVGLLGTALAPQMHQGAARRLYEGLPQQIDMTETGRKIASRSHAVLLSDFYFPIEELSGFCGGLAARQVQGVLVQTCDPAEENFPFSGRVKFQDTEDLAGASLLIPQVEAVREEYTEKFLAHRAEIKKLAESLGWEFVVLSTKTPYETALTQLYDVLMGAR